MLNGSYDTDYKEKLSLFVDLLTQNYGAPSQEDNLRGLINRIDLCGNATNHLLFSDGVQHLENVCVITVKQEAIVNQLYIDLDSIELILSDDSLQKELFEKISSFGSRTYTVKDKQVENIGLIIRFFK